MQAGFETMLGYKNVIISHPNRNKSVMACCDGSGVVQTKCFYPSMQNRQRLLYDKCCGAENQI